MIRVNIKGTRRVRRKSIRLEKGLKRIVEKFGKEMVDALEKVTPKRTGKMAKSWELLKKEEGKYVLTNKAKYAKFVLYGTRKRIFPKKAKVLRFVSRGRVWYAPSVRGQKPQLQKILDKASKLLKPLLAIALKRLKLEVK